MSPRETSDLGLIIGAEGSIKSQTPGSIEAGSEGGDFVYYSCKKISFLNTLLDQGIGETDLFPVSSSKTLCKSLFIEMFRSIEGKQNQLVLSKHTRLVHSN